MPKEKSKITRRPKFSSGELEKLKQEVEKRKKILFAAFSSTITHHIKSTAWSKVADEVNKVSSHNRTTDEVKKKWENLKSEIKGKLAEKYKKGELIRTGGGGPSVDLPTGDEERMLAIIGQDSVFGIQGGIDSSCVEISEFQLSISKSRTEFQPPKENVKLLEGNCKF
jgi:Myb/SANT-like DNA-binding domain